MIPPAFSFCLSLFWLFLCQATGVESVSVLSVLSFIWFCCSFFFFLFSSHLASNGGQDCPSMGPEICGSQITPALRPSQRSCQLSQLQETSFSTTKPPVCWASRKVSGSYASWFQIEDFPALFTSCLSSEGGSYTHGTEKCSLQLFFFHSLPSKCLKCLVVSLGSIALTYFSWMRV